MYTQIWDISAYMMESKLWRICKISKLKLLDTETALAAKDAVDKSKGGDELFRFKFIYLFQLQRYLR